MTTTFRRTLEQIHAAHFAKPPGHWGRSPFHRAICFPLPPFLLLLFISPTVCDGTNENRLTVQPGGGGSTARFKFFTFETSDFDALRRSESVDSRCNVKKKKNKANAGVYQRRHS